MGHLHALRGTVSGVFDLQTHDLGRIPMTSPTASSAAATATAADVSQP